MFCSNTAAVGGGRGGFQKRGRGSLRGGSVRGGSARGGSARGGAGRGGSIRERLGNAKPLQVTIPGQKFDARDKITINKRPADAREKLAEKARLTDARVKIQNIKAKKVEPVTPPNTDARAKLTAKRQGSAVQVTFGGEAVTNPNQGGVFTRTVSILTAVNFRHLHVHIFTSFISYK